MISSIKPTVTTILLIIIIINKSLIITRYMTIYVSFFSIDYAQVDAW